MNQKRLFILAMVILAVALSRLIPHPPNFTPILAMALFGGAVFTSARLAFLLPLSALLISDLIIGFHSQMVIVYASFAVVVVMGGWLRNHRGVLPVVGTTVAGSLLFFLTTNFGVWLFDGLYPADLSGLVACYVAAIPFLQNSMAGDLFYVAILFGGYALATRHYRWLDADRELTA